MSKLDNVQYSNDMIISIKLIQEAVGNLECGKSAGPDGIFAESIKFVHHRIHVLLSLCFSLCLTHGYMPLDMIKTTIVPVIKNKCGNLATVTIIGLLQLPQSFLSYMSLLFFINVKIF